MEYLDGYMIKREATVVKANELIQKSRFSLSAGEQKLILFLISLITPFDAEFKEYDFSIAEYCKICGIEYGGHSYKEIKEQIKRIADKSIWIKQDDGTDVLLRWIEKAKINKSGIIKVRLDEDMKPYLLQLGSNFTKYELIYTLNFKSKYSIRLYEIANSIHYDTLKPYRYRYELEQFKELLGAENYKDFKDFKKRVLTPAQEEINKYSDKNISFNKILRGRKIIGLELVVESKDSKSLLDTRVLVEQRMKSDYSTVWDRVYNTPVEELKK